MVKYRTINRKLNEGISNVELSIPLFIRLLEFAREENLDDVALHVLLENVINLGSRVLDMSDYKALIYNIEVGLKSEK